MKKNKFEGLWEDEESIKMQQIIRKNCKEEQKRITKDQEKEDKKVVAIIILAGIFFILAFAWLLKICGDQYNSAVQGCVDNGHSQAWCEAKYS